ncbi:MAG: hypothetical protein RJQ09_01260 [Cyclobacteriaceae bacterium]
MKRTIYILIVLTIPILGFGQGYQTLEEKTSSFKAKKKVKVMNINGPITVVGSDRSDIKLSYELKAKPEYDGGLENAKEDLSFTVKEYNDSLVVYLDGPFIRWREGRRHINHNSEDYDYRFNCVISLEVPTNIDLDVSTINQGNVKVSNISGKVIAENVNSGVELTNIRGTVVANAINGDIDVDFDGNPGSGSFFETVNGDIKTKVPTNLSASVAFKSMIGEFYTDLNYTSEKTGIVKKNDRNTTYKIEQLTQVKFGNGEADMYFETLNGNMYLRSN